MTPNIEKDREAGTPKRIWIHWLAVNQTFLGYDEPPATEYDECHDAFVRADVADALTAANAALQERVAELTAALDPFALMSIEGVVRGQSGYVKITTQAEYFHRAAAALDECHE